MKSILYRLLITIVVLYVSTEVAFGHHTIWDSTVTHFTTVQRERHDTRWTLTQWLLIKERMRLMDVYLAMFSNPSKDKFKPELNASYYATRGIWQAQDGDNILTSQSGLSSGTMARSQLWLTNMLTASTRMRVLNIDFGFEGMGRDNIGSESVVTQASSTPLAPRHSFQVFTGNFRLFGKNIQDSSLVAKYGRYNMSSVGLSDQSNIGSSASYSGIVNAAELQLYFAKWFGVEGDYIRFNTSTPRLDGSYIQEGTYSNFLAYIEIGLLRLTSGVYTETWQYESATGTMNFQNAGTIAGVKLQF